ncbi:MAG: M48 family metallopeptidase [Cyclobacteriaceae bacterium]|nr:M48 family metallopeptidase [Cyclobacteriaceae bacterium]UYN88297.1 MAG: M48 family metallopeptidase [Cyclobacteriaceae bacterium]
MAGYVGIQAQISRNNRMSVFYLIAFPALVLGCVYAFLYFVSGDEYRGPDVDQVNNAFISVAPIVSGIVLVWFLIAFAFHNKMIDSATGAHTLARKDNMRVYNLVENLCMTEGMTMPKVHIIEDPALNAFASGLSEKSYTVTLTRGIIDKLNDQELEGVIAHELMHIRNRDVRLLVITIIFVGIFSFVVQILFRNMLYGGSRSSKKDNKGAIVALVIAAVAYFLALLFRFGLSRKREYMADAGAAEMTRNPQALASALRKVSGNYEVKAVKNDDVKEMFIHNHPDKSSGFMGGLEGLFATHPPIEKRIKVLEQF